MLYPLSYRGIYRNGSGMLTPVTDLVNRGYLREQLCQRPTKRDRPPGRSLAEKLEMDRLRRARLVLGFREHASTVQRIVDDLAHGRSFRINVHPVASFEVSDDALSCDFESNAVQLGIPARLDMIDSHKPLIQRQVCIKSHDCLNSSIRIYAQMYKQ
jgi:hypothetical protein